MPSCVPELLRWLNACKHQEQQGDTLSKGKIFIIGYSRGARWSINLCLQHAELFEGAVILDGFAESTGDWQQEQEALDLMQAPVRILMVHGLDDELCRP